MKKTEKIRFEIDPHNRLVYEKTGRESNVSGFRTVVDGKFEIDSDNQITYHVKESQGSCGGRIPERSIGIPQQLKLKGKWALDEGHNLVFALDKWGNQIAGNKLTLQSELMDAKDDMLSFTVTSKDSDGVGHIYIIKLGGRWQADEHNRLVFHVEKEKGLTDKITLEGAWEVNKENAIVYRYEKSSQGTTKTITLNGYWEIAGKNRIRYVLNKSAKSEFDFKVSVGKPAARGLEYEIGIGASPRQKTVTLFGSWKVSKNSGVSFEMPCAQGKIRGVILGGWVKLDNNNKLELKLQSEAGEELGIDVKLSRDILDGQGEAFIHALRSGKEVFITAGAGFRW